MGLALEAPQSHIVDVENALLVIPSRARHPGVQRLYGQREGTVGWLVGWLCGGGGWYPSRSHIIHTFSQDFSAVVDCVDNMNTTPLMHASAFGLVDLVDLLLKCVWS